MAASDPYEIGGEMEFNGEQRLPEPSDEQQVEASEPEPVEIVARWLRETLAEGPMAVSEILPLAAARGYSEKQLRAGREAIGVKPYQESRAWHWQLPDPASIPVPEPDPEDEPPTDEEVHSLIEELGEDWEKLGWLDHDPPVDWIEPLQARHRQAVRDYAEAVRDVGRIRARTEKSDRDYRRRVVKALSAGERPPARAANENGVVADARQELASDVAEERAEELAQVVLDALAEIRIPLLDVQGVSFSRSLAYALERGPGAFNARQRQRLEAQLRAASAGGIEILSEAEPLDYQEVPS
jgi:hypothetical protein